MTTLHLSERQIAKIERPYWTRFWGQRRKCKPRFVRALLGDGGRLVHIMPLMTRPHWYGIRVDSTWIDDVLGEHIEEILEAIEAEYGWYSDGCSSEFEGNNGKYPGWPVLFREGVCWGTLDPKEFHIRINRKPGAAP